MLEFLGSTLDSAPILAPCSIPAPCKAAGDSSSSEVPAPAFCSLSLSQPLRHLNGKPANGSCVSLFLPLFKILYYLSMDLFEGWNERRRDTERDRTFHLLVYFPTNHNSHRCGKLQPAARNNHLPHEQQEPKYMEHHTLSPKHMSGKLV